MGKSISAITLKEVASEALTCLILEYTAPKDCFAKRSRDIA